MTFDEFQVAVRDRQDDFPTAANLPLTWFATACVEELGEMFGHIKRIDRDDGGKLSGERRDKILIEAGDFLAYFSIVLDRCGILPSELYEPNIAKVDGRIARNTQTGEGDDR